MNARIASWNPIVKETKKALKEALAASPNLEFTIIGLDDNGVGRDGTVFTMAEAPGVYVEVRKSNSDLMAVLYADPTTGRVTVS